MAGLTLARFDDLMKMARTGRVLSLQAPLGVEGDEEIGALVADVSAQSPYDEIEEQSLRDDLAATLETALDERELQILRLRFGLGDGAAMTFRDVAHVMGMSHERVRQIERQALQKLREESRLSA